MIGNDIVDLGCTPAMGPVRARRFAEKILSEKEIQKVMSSRDIIKHIWLLWSMKESAYKAHFQRYQQRFFHPSEMECRLTKDGKGIVIVRDKPYFTASSIRADHIHTVARSAMSEKILDGFIRISDASYDNQHQHAYRAALQTYAQYKKISTRHLHIQKDNAGIPRILERGRSVPVALSISHHGKFCAFAFTTA